MTGKPQNRTHSIVLTFLIPIMLMVLSLAAAGDVLEKGESLSRTDAVNFSHLKDSIKGSLDTEKQILKDLREKLDLAKKLQKSLGIELDAYRIQLSAQNNLLLMSQTNLNELEKARADSTATLDMLNKRLDNLKKEAESFPQQNKRTLEQLNVNQQHLDELKTQPSKSGEGQSLESDLRELVKILSAKQNVLEKIAGIYQSLVGSYEGLRKSFADLNSNLADRIAADKQNELFQREPGPFSIADWKQLIQELGPLTARARSITSAEFWIKNLQVPNQADWSLVAAGLILFGLTLMLLIRLKRFCANLSRTPWAARSLWRLITIRIFYRSVLLMGTVLFIYVYARVRMLYTTVEFIQMFVQALIVWLFSRWFLDLFSLVAEQKERFRINMQMFKRLRRLIRMIRWFAIPYVIVGWLFNQPVPVLGIFRLLFEIALILWVLKFRKISRTEAKPFEAGGTRTKWGLKSSGIGLFYLIAGGGLFLELAGYHSLSLYWFVSWGRTAVVLLWGGLVLQCIRELEGQHQPGALNAKEAEEPKGYPFRWLFFRIAWLVWIAALLACITLAWGAFRALVVALFHILKYPVHVGSTRLNLMSFVYGALILLVTHAATRFARYALREKILDNSHMEPGLQESITTITFYLLWVFGILFSLHAVGLNPTSLAVAFGALGIGLGFGLQNIFNNFISGIILLFERPIQVGDAIEINGIWGTVKKINVRATLVQTYDNASLIIPNSEFISTQLTNWSFKDLRLRRSVTVGVAYGSDIELVRSTLLEIPPQVSGILYYPKPDVLFTDFGDSALVFKLRFWTHIDNMLVAETSVRFLIDRLFRERHIEISFPQRDIHIRSIQKEGTIRFTE